MADKTNNKDSKPAATEAPAAAATTPRPRAVMEVLDFSTAVDEDALASTPRRSKWITLLDALYEATVVGKVPRTEEGDLKFIKLGAFANVNGARTQARALEQRGLGDVYEFRGITKGDGSELFGRVIEIDVPA